MSTLTFRAHCARGHDRLDYTDRAAFEAHMTGEHGARKPSHGGPAWCGPRPYPWKAPEAPATTEKLTAVLVKAAAGEYRKRGDWRDHLDPDWHTDDVVRVDTLEAGDLFAVKGATRYTVADTDDARVLVRMHGDEGTPDREKWIGRAELLAQVERMTGSADVIRLGRAA